MIQSFDFQKILLVTYHIVLHVNIITLCEGYIIEDWQKLSCNLRAINKIIKNNTEHICFVWVYMYMDLL